MFKKFMIKFKPMMPYLFITELFYYLAPFIAIAIGDLMIMAILLLVVFPVVTFICAFICSQKHGYSWIYTIVAAVLFIPTVFMFYNSSALIYVTMYAIASILGNMLGDLLGKKKRELKKMGR